jgi:hypothetical protein
MTEQFDYDLGNLGASFKIDLDALNKAKLVVADFVASFNTGISSVNSSIEAVDSGLQSVSNVKIKTSIGIDKSAVNKELKEFDANFKKHIDDLSNRLVELRSEMDNTLKIKPSVEGVDEYKSNLKSLQDEESKILKQFTEIENGRNRILAGDDSMKQFKIQAKEVAQGLKEVSNVAKEVSNEKKAADAEEKRIEKERQARLNQYKKDLDDILRIEKQKDRERLANIKALEKAEKDAEREKIRLKREADREEALRIRQQQQRLQEQQALDKQRLKNIQDFTGANKEQEKSLLSVGAAAIIAAVGINKLKNYAKEAVTTFKDFEKLGRVFQHTFGKNTENVLKWSREVRDNFAVTRQEVMKLTSNVTIMLRSFEFAGKGVEETAQNISKLIFDVSSFRGVPVEEAFNAIQQSLTGYYRALRQFGIVITGSQVEQEALRMGLISTRDELNEQHKVMARLSLLYQRFEPDVGDVSRSQETMFYQLRKLRVNFVELGTELGKQISRVWQPFLKVINGILEGVTKLMEKFPNLTSILLAGGVVGGTAAAGATAVGGKGMISRFLGTVGSVATGTAIGGLNKETIAQLSKAIFSVGVPAIGKDKPKINIDNNKILEGIIGKKGALGEAYAKLHNTFIQNLIDDRMMLDKKFTKGKRDSIVKKYIDTMDTDLEDWLKGFNDYIRKITDKIYTWTDVEIMFSDLAGDMKANKLEPYLRKPKSGMPGVDELPQTDKEFFYSYVTKHRGLPNEIRDDVMNTALMFGDFFERLEFFSTNLTKRITKFLPILGKMDEPIKFANTFKEDWLELFPVFEGSTAKIKDSIVSGTKAVVNTFSKESMTSALSKIKETLMFSLNIIPETVNAIKESLFMGLDAVSSIPDIIYKFDFGKNLKNIFIDIPTIPFRGLVKGLVSLKRGFDKIIVVVSKLWKALAPLLTVIAKLAAIITTLWAAVKVAWGFIKGIGLPEALKSLKDRLVKVTEKIPELEGALDSIVRYFKEEGVIKGFFTALEDMGAGLGGAVRGIFGGKSNFSDAVYENILKRRGKAEDKLNDEIKLTAAERKQAEQEMLDALKDNIKQLIDSSLQGAAVSNKLSETLKTLDEGLKNFKRGGKVDKEYRQDLTQSLKVDKEKLKELKESEYSDDYQSYRYREIKRELDDLNKEKSGLESAFRQGRFTSKQIEKGKEISAQIKELEKELAYEYEHGDKRNDYYKKIEALEKSIAETQYKLDINKQRGKFQHNILEDVETEMIEDLFDVYSSFKNNIYDGFIKRTELERGKEVEKFIIEGADEPLREFELTDPIAFEYRQQMKVKQKEINNVLKSIEEMNKEELSEFINQTEHLYLIGDMDDELYNALIGRAEYVRDNFKLFTEEYKQFLDERDTIWETISESLNEWKELSDTQKEQFKESVKEWSEKGLLDDVEYGEISAEVFNNTIGDWIQKSIEQAREYMEEMFKESTQLHIDLDESMADWYNRQMDIDYEKWKKATTVYDTKATTGRAAFESMNVSKSLQNIFGKYGEPPQALTDEQRKEMEQKQLWERMVDMQSRLVQLEEEKMRTVQRYPGVLTMNNGGF